MTNEDFKVGREHGDGGSFLRVSVWVSIGAQLTSVGPINAPVATTAHHRQRGCAGDAGDLSRSYLVEYTSLPCSFLFLRRAVRNLLHLLQALAARVQQLGGSPSPSAWLISGEALGVAYLPADYRLARAELANRGPGFQAASARMLSAAASSSDKVTNDSIHQRDRFYKKVALRLTRSHQLCGQERPSGARPVARRQRTLQKTFKAPRSKSTPSFSGHSLSGGCARRSAHPPDGL
jgi:hypothetical protein